MSYTKIWSVEYYDGCDGWISIGYYSSKENAQKALAWMRKDEMYDETSEFRIVWHFIDFEMEEWA